MTVSVPQPASAAESDPPQGSGEWHALRESRLTASTFCNAVGFFSRGRVELWKEKVGLGERFAGNQLTQWGQRNEGGAVDEYKQISGNQVHHMGFKVSHSARDQRAA